MKNKTNFLIYPFVIMGLCLILTAGCKKDVDNTQNATQLPVLTTATVSNITTTTAPVFRTFLQHPSNLL